MKPTLRMILLAVALGGSVSQGTAQVLVTNLDQGSDGSGNSGPYVGQTFATGTEAVTVTGAVIDMDDSIDTANTQLFIYSDNSGQPGTLLDTLSYQSSGPDGAGADLLTYSSIPFDLTAATTYWLVAYDANLGSSYGWDYADGAASSNYDMTLPDGVEYGSNGTTWTGGYSGEQLKLSLTTTSAPEPAVWTMVLLSLGLITIGGRALRGPVLTPRKAPVAEDRS